RPAARQRSAVRPPRGRARGASGGAALGRPAARPDDLDGDALRLGGALSGSPAPSAVTGTSEGRPLGLWPGRPSIVGWNLHRFFCHYAGCSLAPASKSRYSVVVHNSL